MVAGTKAETVIAIIEKIPLKQRNLVTEITLDMAGNMGLIAKKCFPNELVSQTAFTFKNQLQKLYKKSELNTAGKPQTKEMRLQKKPKRTRKGSNPKF